MFSHCIRQIKTSTCRTFATARPKLNVKYQKIFKFSQDKEQLNFQKDLDRYEDIRRNISVVETKIKETNRQIYTGSEQNFGKEVKMMSGTRMLANNDVNQETVKTKQNLQRELAQLKEDLSLIQGKLYSTPNRSNEKIEKNNVINKSSIKDVFSYEYNFSNIYFSTDHYVNTIGGKPSKAERERNEIYNRAIENIEAEVSDMVDATIADRIAKFSLFERSFKPQDILHESDSKVVYDSAVELERLNRIADFDDDFIKKDEDKEQGRTITTLPNKFELRDLKAKRYRREVSNTHNPDKNNVARLSASYNIKV